MLSKNLLPLMEKQSRSVKRIFQFSIYIVIMSLSFLLSVKLRLLDVLQDQWMDSFTVMSIAIPTSLIGLYYGGVYRAIWRFTSWNIMKSIALWILVSAVLMLFLISLLGLQVPRSVPFIYFSISVIAIGCVKLFAASMYQIDSRQNAKKVAIFGAGAAGRQLRNALQYSHQYNPVTFIDDDDNLAGSEIAGLRVLSFDEFKSNIDKLDVSTILVAVPSAPATVRGEIIRRLEPFNINIKIIPGLSDIIESRVSIEQVRDVPIEDLLERQIIPPKSALLRNIKNKVVMVTGAGGSIGSELCRQIWQLGAKTLIIFDNSEYSLYSIDDELIQIEERDPEFPRPILATKLGSVTDRMTLDALITKYQVDIIYHAAAFKHVPLAESNATQAIINNVFGTKNVVEAALANHVSEVIMISTDKAVRPTNVMGASKRLAELVCQAYAKTKGTTISMVRFGNVMGSSGSVIPRFRKQIERGGPVTVTHREVTRYFMTIKEAAQLVIQAGSMAKGGDVFLLDMGKPVKIYDLARRMIQLQGKQVITLDATPPSEQTTDEDGNANGILIEITGLRPGEKLYEELLIEQESHDTDHPLIFTAIEKSISLDSMKQLLDNLQTACKTNDNDQIRQLLSEAPIDYQPPPY